MASYRLPLSQEELYSALSYGHGRAVQHLRAHGDAGLEEELRDAFIFDYRYDLQTHECRADWLYAMLPHVQNPAYYRNAVCGALNSLADPLSWHAEQLCELARRFASDGDANARKALDEAVERVGVGWRQILILDGAGALPYLITIREKLDGDVWDLMHGAERILGKESARTAFQAEAERSEEIQRAVAELESVENHPRSPPITLEAVTANIEAGSHSLVMLFGRNASDEDLSFLWHWFLREQRPEQLLCLLWVFRLRRCPELADKLFDLARSADEDLRYHARVALGHWTTESVRDLGLELLNRSERIVERGVLDLFFRNFQPGDAARLEARLPTAPTETQDEEYARHHITGDVIDITEANNTQELAGCLLWVYEYAACGVCRRAAVRELHRRGVLPQTILEECRDDAEPETRALVRGFGDGQR